MKFAQVIMFLCLSLLMIQIRAEPQQVTPLVGKVLFSMGQASIASFDGSASSAVFGGGLVYEGDTLHTSADSHLHVQMIDGALLVLRPASAVKIVNYHIDSLEPVNNRILLDMQKGVVRSVTGKGGEANKQGFRLNTPVAAIGIRGTDFTVLASAGLSSVTLKDGGVIVSPFSADCPRYAVGACSGSQSVLLTSLEQQMLAEVRPSKAMRIPKVNASVIPDKVAPAHPLEEQSLQESKTTPTVSTQVPSVIATPTVPNAASVVANNESKTGDKSGQNSTQTTTTTTTTVNSGNNKFTVVSPSTITADDSVAIKVGSASGSTAEVASLTPVTAEVGPKESVTSELVSRVVADNTANKNVKTVQVVAEDTKISVDNTTDATTPIVPATTPQPFYWGRWSSDDPAQMIARDATKNRQIFTANQVYLLADSDPDVPQLPPSGTVSFKLNAGEAVIVRDNEQLLPASIRNARLEANFDQNRFATGLTVDASTLPDGSVDLVADGQLQRDTGRFYSTLGSTMSVSGALSDNADHAAYHFTDRINNVEGVTTWSRQ